MRATKGKPLLPVVNPEISFNAQHALPADTRQFINDQLRRIGSENPIIADWIKDWAKLAETADSRAHTALGGIVVYMLLKSQAESDRMVEELRLS